MYGEKNRKWEVKGQKIKNRNRNKSQTKRSGDDRRGKRFLSLYNKKTIFKLNNSTNIQIIHFFGNPSQSWINYLISIDFR